MPLLRLCHTLVMFPFLNNPECPGIYAEHDDLWTIDGGLGMLVDNGIVVVENIYRLMEEEGLPRIEAEGIGEIASPIIIFTATTVAAFVPLSVYGRVLWVNSWSILPIMLSVVLDPLLFVVIFDSVHISAILTRGFTYSPYKTHTVFTYFS